MNNGSEFTKNQSGGWGWEGFLGIQHVPKLEDGHIEGDQYSLLFLQHVIFVRFCRISDFVNDFLRHWKQHQLIFSEQGVIGACLYIYKMVNFDAHDLNE